MDAYDLDCGDGFTAYAYLQTHKTVYIKYAGFLYMLYFNKVGLKKKRERERIMWLLILLFCS